MRMQHFNSSRIFYKKSPKIAVIFYGELHLFLFFVLP